LQRAGYSVLSARNAADALKMLGGEGSIDLLLSDVEMGGMNGIELGRRTKIERPDIGVLLYSANLVYAAHSEFPFLGKPFLPNDLLSLVANVLASRPVLAAVPPPVAGPSPQIGPVLVKGRRRRHGFTPILVAAGLVLCSIPLGMLRKSAPAAGRADAVDLRTWRGLAGGAAAKAGRSLVLNLNLTGIPRHDSYRIELVDIDGHNIWQQVIPASNTEVLQARSHALKAGVYYIRAYASPEGLLREFELHIGENQ